MSSCSACGAQFACGMVAQDHADETASQAAACWCMSFPPVLAVPATDAGTSCLCPRCLQARVQQKADLSGLSGLTGPTSG